MPSTARSRHLLLIGAAGVYLVAAPAIGLLISTGVAIQQQAMFVLFFVLMISLLMSGLLTPIDSMPHWVQLLSEINPVRHFVSMSRQILIKARAHREPSSMAREGGGIDLATLPRDDSGG